MIISLFVKYPIGWNLSVWECLLTYLLAGLSYLYHSRSIRGLNYFDDSDSIYVNSESNTNNESNGDNSNDEESILILNESNQNQYQALTYSNNSENKQIEEV